MGNQGEGRAAKIVGNGIFAIIILLLSLLAFILIQGKITNAPPSLAGHRMYIVLSGSMKPAFDTGSLIMVKPMSPEGIQVGDVVSFRSTGDENKIVTHRVMAIEKTEEGFSFNTRGDANDVLDPYPIPGGNIIGKVSVAVPYLGYVMDFASTKKGILTLLAIPALMLLISETGNVYKLLRKASENEEG